MILRVLDKVTLVVNTKYNVSKQENILLVLRVKETGLYLFDGLLIHNVSTINRVRQFGKISNKILSLSFSVPIQSKNKY